MSLSFVVSLASRRGGHSLRPSSARTTARLLWTFRPAPKRSAPSAEAALAPSRVRCGEGAARRLLQARGQARGLRAHLGTDRARLEEAQGDVEFPGLDCELDLLEVGRDLVVSRNVRADVMGRGRLPG